MGANGYTRAVDTSSDPANPDTPAGDRPLSILVFGQSNATGEHLANPAVAWPKLAANELSARLGRPATLEIRPIYVHSGAVERYLDRELEKYRPDIVLFGASSFAFAQKMVGLSIRRRWGDRPADWYQAIERRVDARTRHSKSGSRFNRFARKTLTRVLGAEAVASYATVIEGSETALRRLAREEALSVAVFQINSIVAGYEDPAIRRELARFDADIRVIAERYRFPVVDVRQPLMKAPDQAGMMFPDRLHYTERAHRIMADEVMRAFEDGTIEIPR